MARAEKKSGSGISLGSAFLPFFCVSWIEGWWGMPRGVAMLWEALSPAVALVTARRVLQIRFCSRPYKAKAILVLSIRQRWNSSPFPLVLPCPGKGPGDALCGGAQLGILRPFGLGAFSLIPALCRLWGGTSGICCH